MNLLDKFDYQFPERLIAQKPAHPRDSARLLVYDRKTKRSTHDTFKNLGAYLPPNAVLVLNQTKVIPARMLVKKPTGGIVELLYLSNDGETIHALLNKQIEPGTVLRLTKTTTFTAIKKLEKGYKLKPSFPISKLFDILNRYGHTPIPPYIKYSTLSEKKLREEYQTIFAKLAGSVAAPTASLHFTKRLFVDLKKRGIDTTFVTLHVGLGTFAPVTTDQLTKKKLHKEFYSIDKTAADFLDQAKKQGRPIIAVGTTVVRTLESATDKSGRLKKLSGATDLFIQEKDKIKFVDCLITNFHVPKSSLMMLVSAFVGRTTLLNLYKKAIARKYRLFSFGDGMLIL